MLAELLKFFLEFLKLAPRYFVAVAIVSGALLFFPDDFLDRIGLSTFVKDNRQWLGLALLVSSTLWTVFIIASGWNSTKKLLLQRKVRRRVVKKLQALTEGEKEILRYYLAENTRANVLKIDDGVVQGLVTSRIIYRSTSMGNLVEGFGHNITDFAWDYLHLYPGLLDGTNNYYRTDKRQRGW
jgi:hypothetical protein